MRPLPNAERGLKKWFQNRRLARWSNVPSCWPRCRGEDGDEKTEKCVTVRTCLRATPIATIFPVRCSNGCRNALETLNFTVNKVAPATPTNQRCGKWYSGTARGTSWTLFFGAMAGAAVGVLNLTAVAHQWKLEDDFDLLNLPVTSLMHAAQQRLDFPRWLAVIDCVAITLYWPLIGLFLSLIYSLVRERTCRWRLFFGASGGILIGYLNLLAIANRWHALWAWFDFLDQPIQPLEEAIRDRIETLRLVESLRLYRTYSTAGRPDWRLTFLGYWFVIGLLLTSLFSVVRILKKRKAARGHR